MSRLFSGIIFSFFLLFQTISIADEGDIEPLMVPETSSEEINSDEETEVTDEAEEQEIPVEDVPIKENSEEETTPDSEEESNENNTEDAPLAEQAEEPQVEDEPVVEAPSEDELEARRAEEAELREVGAGEEPVIEE